MTLDPLAVAGKVIDALDRLGLRYSIGGSMASTFAGEPRSTLDVDIVVEISDGHVAPLISLLRPEFYVDAVALHRAVMQRGNANLIHSASSVKIDVFVAGGTVLDQTLLDRRRRV